MEKHGERWRRMEAQRERTREREIQREKRERQRGREREKERRRQRDREREKLRGSTTFWSISGLALPPCITTTEFSYRSELVKIMSPFCAVLLEP